jgi:hypothetical protein
LRVKEVPGASVWFQPVAPEGRAASEALAARLASSVVVCVTVPVFFHVTLPPNFRQTLAGLNLRESVASTVTADWGLEQVEDEPELDDELLEVLVLETTVICPSIPRVSCGMQKYL